MEARHDQSSTTGKLQCLLGLLRGVVVDNYGVAPECGIQPTDELVKSCYKPFLFTLDLYIWKLVGTSIKRDAHVRFPSRSNRSDRGAQAPALAGAVTL